jgi:3-oxoacyl-[acyl-carrier-protein] synthase III
VSAVPTNMATSLAIAGLGVFLPPSRPVRAAIADSGGDATAFQGWECVCQASDVDHPSTMAAAALERALADADMPRDRVRLVLSTGNSRDYGGAWSLSTDVMRRLGFSSTCLGIDLSVGCLGTLCALEIAAGWLGTDDACAIIAAERWSRVIDRADRQSMLYWATGDGAGAMVVGRDVPNRLATYCGAVFVSESGFNDDLAFRYGGTRCPTPPPGESVFALMSGPRGHHELWRHYTTHYSQVLAATRTRFGVAFDRLVCNQVSPLLVTKIGRLANVSDDRISRTGPEAGHIGSVDLVLGLERLRQRDQLAGNIALVASTPSAFGAGLLQSLPAYA